MLLFLAILRILDYLGFLKLPDEKVTSFVSQITPLGARSLHRILVLRKFSTLEFDEFVSFMLLARAPWRARFHVFLVRGL